MSDKLALLLQSRYRGNRARIVHVKRAREGAIMICPFVACTPVVVACLLDAANLQPGDNCLDLGCGDGAICVGVANLHIADVNITGYEIDHVLCDVARRRCVTFTCVKIEQRAIEDVANEFLSMANVIFVFLTPSCLRVLSTKFRCLTLGTRIVCYKYPLSQEWVPTKVFETEDILSNRPAQVFHYVNDGCHRN